MKKIISLMLCATLLCLSLLSLAACGGIRGEYVSLTGNVTYEFVSSKKLKRIDPFLEHVAVYTYEIEKNGQNRYMVLTLDSYEYEGEDASVKAYVASLNEALAKAESPTVERYAYAEAESGLIVIGNITYQKKD